MELFFTKAAKIIIICMAWVIAQLSEVSGGIVSQGFDQLFSIGLLLVVLFMLWKEYKEGKEYNRKRDNELKQVLDANNEEIAEYRHEMRQNRKLMGEFHETLKNLNRNLERLNNA